MKKKAVIGAIIGIVLLLIAVYFLVQINKENRITEEQAMTLVIEKILKEKGYSRAGVANCEIIEEINEEKAYKLYAFDEAGNPKISEALGYYYVSLDGTKIYEKKMDDNIYNLVWSE